MYWDGIILEIYYTGGSLPYIYACYDNNGILTKNLIYQETGSLSTNQYIRKEIFISYENFIGFETNNTGFGSPATYGHIVIHAARKDSNNRLHKIGTFGILSSGSVFTQLRNEISFNTPIKCPGFVLRSDAFTGSNYYGFPSAVIGSTNIINSSCTFTSPAGSTSLSVYVYLHNVGGSPYAIHHSNIAISPSTNYNFYITSSSNQNAVSGDNIFINDPIFKNLLNSSFRIEIIPDVGSITPSGCYYAFDKFLPIASNF